MTGPARFMAFLLMIMLCIITRVTAQITIPGKIYPFNLDYLAYCSSSVQKDATITPVYRNGAFVYADNQTGKALFNLSFQEAYPFVNGYGLVKTGGLYGVINRDGKYVVTARFPAFRLDREPNRITFGKDTAFLFSGELTTEVPLKCMEYRMSPFYGIKQGKKVALFASGDVYGQPGLAKRPLLLCDSVLGSNFTQSIVMKRGRIGAVNEKGETVIPFEYTAYATNPGVDGKVPEAGMPDFFALQKGQEWYYYAGSRFLFKSPIKAVGYDFNYFMYKQNGFFNALNNKGEPVLKHNYQWLAGNSMALTTDDRLVFLLSDGKEVVYYEKPAGK